MVEIEGVFPSKYTDEQLKHIKEVVDKIRKDKEWVIQPDITFELFDKFIIYPPYKIDDSEKQPTKPLILF